MLGNVYATLSPSERTALLSGSGIDVSGTSFCGTSSAASAGFYLFQGTSAAGETSLRVDVTNGQLILTSEGAALLTSTGLGSTPAAPTSQNFVFGDRFDWRFWDTRAGGARSAGIRVAVNGCCGFDTVTTSSGSAFTALTSAIALASSSSGIWLPTNSSLAGPTSANTEARGVMIGDSISAPRGLNSALGAKLGALGAAGPIASLAQGGARADQQLTTWQGSRYRGDSAVVWVYIQVGTNDIVQGASAATLITRIQAIVDDIATNNPTADIFVGTMTPQRGYLLAAQHTIWTDVNTAILGGGGTPITGITASVNTVTAMSDGNDNLLYHDTVDNLHPTELGRYWNVVPIAAALTAAGVLT